MTRDAGASPAARWPAAVLVAGVLLLAASPLLPRLVPTRAVWTDADAQAYNAAATDLHAKTFARQDDARTAAQRNFDQMQARLRAARSQQNWPKYAALTAGVLLIVVGIAQYARQR
jgi:hypothetical protein